MEEERPGARGRYAHVFIGDPFKPGLTSIAARAILAEEPRLSLLQSFL